MTVRRKLKSFLSMSVANRVLVSEAIFALVVARLIVLTVPFRLLEPWLSRSPEISACDEVLLFSVRRAVTIAARNVPWSAICLPQAIAAKTMLARRGCGSTLHLGAAFDSQGHLIAHAWLAAGGTVVVGAAGIAGVTPLARFG